MEVFRLDCVEQQYVSITVVAMTMQHIRRTFLVAFVLTVVSGCGDSRPKSASLHGEVRFQGKPVAEGAIRLFPTKGTSGHGAGSRIVEGRYEIAEAKGLVEGTYLASITASRRTGRQSPRLERQPNDAPFTFEIEQYLPRKYNDESELTVTLTSGRNKYDFQLP